MYICIYMYVYMYVYIWLYVALDIHMCVVSASMIMFAHTRRVCLCRVHVARACMAVCVVCQMAGTNHSCMHAIETRRHDALRARVRQPLQRSHTVCVCVCVPEQESQQQSDHDAA